LQKQKKLVSSLKTLEKIENAAVQKLQPELAQMNQRIEDVELKISTLNFKLEREKEFLKENINLDYIEFFARITQEIQTLNAEKEHLLKEFTVLHERMMDHVLKEKAYTSIKNKNLKSIKEELEKKEEENIADIINMRYFFNEK
jgi:predicted  nucleic acid-binding Zn-ribbon protein